MKFLRLILESNEKRKEEIKDEDVLSEVKKIKKKQTDRLCYLIECYFLLETFLVNAWKMFKYHVFIIKYGDLMSYTAKVTSKSMVTIPAKIMKKHGIKEGMRIKFIESETGILMIPIPRLEDLRGIDSQYAALIIEGIRELEAEHREEARE